MFQINVIQKNISSAGHKHNIKITNKSLKNVAKFRYLGMTVTNQNDVHKAIKIRVNSVNVFFNSI
jgi:hypothetical protein